MLLLTLRSLISLRTEQKLRKETLKANGIISKTLDGVKMLGRGELNKSLL